jgi:hypothetical protein
VYLLHSHCHAKCWDCNEKMEWSRLLLGIASGFETRSRFRSGRFVLNRRTFRVEGHLQSPQQRPVLVRVYGVHSLIAVTPRFWVGSRY